MADNKVSVTITGDNKAGRAFAEAAAEEEAFGRVVNQSLRKEISAQQDIARAENEHLKVSKLLAEADKVMAEGDNVLAGRLHLVHGKLQEADKGAGDLSRTFRSALGDAFSSVFSALGSSAGGGGGVGLLGALGSMGPMFGAIATGAGALVAMLAGPLIAGLGAVAASIGALAIVAIPAFKDISAFFSATSASARRAAWKSMDPAEQGVTRSLQQLGDAFGKIVKAVEPSLMRMFGEGLKVVKDLLPSLKPLAEGAARAFGQFFGQIDHWLNGPSGKKFLHWLDTEGPKAMMRFARALWDMVQVVGRVFSFLDNEGHRMSRRFMENMHTLRDAFDETRHAFAVVGHDIAADFDMIRHAVATWYHDIAHYFDDARHAAATLGHDIASAFDTVRHTLASWAAFVGQSVTAAVNWFRQLPGRILSALGSLPGMLFKAGQNAVRSLISGLGSMLGAVGSMASSIASKIAGFFGLSPAKEGPLSGGGAPEVRGRHFAEAFASGMRAGNLGIAAAAANLAGAAGSGQLRGAATAGLSGPLRIQLEWAGGGQADSEFMTWLMKNIRVRGGSPDIVTRKVQFR